LGKEHRLAERRQNILTAIEAVGQLSVIELSEQFKVSEVTIRQDLQALSKQGLLLRTRGGALSTNTLPEHSFDVRQQQQSAQKVRIGQAAASLVASGDTIILDASTTAQAIIPFIKERTELTVITNSLKAAISLLDAPQIQVILPGGNLRRESISLVGHQQGDVAQALNVGWGFFGVRGVTVEEGLTDVNLEEVAMKRAMVERCRRVVGEKSNFKSKVGILGDWQRPWNGQPKAVLCCGKIVRGERFAQVTNRFKIEERQPQR